MQCNKVNTKYKQWVSTSLFQGNTTITTKNCILEEFTLFVGTKVSSLKIQSDEINIRTQTVSVNLRFVKKTLPTNK